jgi:hypothetical protein
MKCREHLYLEDNLIIFVTTVLKASHICKKNRPFAFAGTFTDFPFSSVPTTLRISNKSYSEIELANDN